MNTICTFCNGQNSAEAVHCYKCNKLLFDNNLNYFQIFSIKPFEDTSTAALNNKLFELQKQFHPDQFVTKNKQEQELTAVYSTKINEAYQTLKDPVKTIEYFLRIHNYELTDKKNLIPQEYMLNIYSHAETLSETTDEEEIKQIVAWLKAEQKQLISLAINEINSLNLANALTSLAKIKYLNSILKSSEKRTTSYI
jgi:molecular chaperone HscB